jgi:hypothetical protein
MDKATKSRYGHYLSDIVYSEAEDDYRGGYDNLFGTDILLLIGATSRQRCKAFARLLQEGHING